MTRVSSLEDQTASTPADTRTRQFAGTCRCGARWGGLAQAHCSICHLTFSTVGNFDRHRKDGDCHNPETVGLVFSENRQVWQMPGRDED